MKIDYGPDENQTEDAVKARIGQDAIAAWDKDGIAPPGWIADSAAIIRNWHGFAESIREHNDNEVAVVVTSNGIARFAPYLAGDFEDFTARHVIKLATGALGVLTYENGRWLSGRLEYQARSPITQLKIPLAPPPGRGARLKEPSSGASLAAAPPPGGEGARL